MTWGDMICLLIVAAIFVLAVYFAIRFLKKMFSPVHVYKIEGKYYITSQKTLTPEKIKKTRWIRIRRKKRK